MPPRKVVVPFPEKLPQPIVWRVTDFGGGANQDANPFEELKDNQFQVYLNAMPKPQGTAGKHPGYSAYTASITGQTTTRFLKRFYDTSKNKHLLAYTTGPTNDKLYKIPDGTPGSPVEIASGEGSPTLFTTGKPGRVFCYRDTAMIFNGTDTCQFTNNTQIGLNKRWDVDFVNMSDVSLDPQPKPHVMAWHSRIARIFYAEQNSDMLHVSEIFPTMPTDGTSDNLRIEGDLKVSTRDGDTITGIAQLGDWMVIFMTHHVIAYTGIASDASSGERVDISSEIGCIAPDSIASAGQILFFRAADGVYALMEDRLQKISNPVIDEITGDISPGTAVGTFHKNTYRLAYHKGGSNHDYEVAWYLDYNAWGINNIAKIGCYGEFLSPTDTPTLFIGDSSSTAIHKYLDTFAAAGNAYNTEIITRNFLPPDAGETLVGEQLRVLAEATDDIMVTTRFSGRETSFTFPFSEAGIGSKWYEAGGRDVFYEYYLDHPEETPARYFKASQGQMYQSLGKESQGQWVSLRFLHSGKTDFVLKGFSLIMRSLGKQKINVLGE